MPSSYFDEDNSHVPTHDNIPRPSSESEYNEAPHKLTDLELHEALPQKSSGPVITPSENSENPPQDSVSEGLMTISPSMPPLEWASPPPPSHDPRPGKPPDSPRNTVGSDIEALLGNLNIDLNALNVFNKKSTDPPVTISPMSVSNITVRKKSKSRSRHFHGRPKSKSLYQVGLYGFHELMISTIDDPRALSACSSTHGSKLILLHL